MNQRLGRLRTPGCHEIDSLQCSNVEGTASTYNAESTIRTQDNEQSEGRKLHKAVSAPFLRACFSSGQLLRFRLLCSI